jgi:uncharacterized repeat protein (TIGR03943 family)
VTERRDRSLLLLLTGSFAVWLVLSGTALNFVRRAMLPYVLVAGVVAVALALLPPMGLLSRRGGNGHEDDGHGHGPGVGVGWLLVLPVLIGLLVPPAPLGANAVRARLASSGTSTGVYPPLAAPVGGAVPMSMAEFSTRALRDKAGSLRDVRVRLRGFVSPGDAPGTYRLGRFVIFCCAADAEAVVVTVTGDAVARRADQWLEVEGTWVPGPGEVPVLAATAVRTVRRPGEPYEYTTVYAG